MAICHGVNALPDYLLGEMQAVCTQEDLRKGEKGDKGDQVGKMLKWEEVMQ